MNRVKPVTVEQAPPAIKPIFDQLKQMMGRVPNIFLNMANSPSTINAFMTLNQLVEKTSLSPNLKTKLALVVSQANHCNYCLSAHSAIAKNMGLQEQDILQARKGEAEEKKADAILKFAKSVVEKHGAVSDQEVANLKAQGVSDQEICEIVLVITLNTFSNFFNNVTNTEIDFPLAPKL